MARHPRWKAPENLPEPHVDKPPAIAPTDLGAPAVRLEVFLAASGIRSDQSAGFRSWAKRMGLGPRAMSAWKQAMTDFGGRPVR